MKKEYFNGEIKGYPLQITNAYVSYMNVIIPVNSISYVARKRKKYSYWRSFVFLIITIACFIIADQFHHLEELNNLGVLFGGLTLFDLVLTFILNDRMYLLIYSHSKEYIEIPLRWLQKQKLFDPVYKALIQAIEDNHSLQENTSKDL